MNTLKPNELLPQAVPSEAIVAAEPTQPAKVGSSASLSCTLPRHTKAEVSNMQDAVLLPSARDAAAVNDFSGDCLFLYLTEIRKRFAEGKKAKKPHFTNDDGTPCTNLNRLYSEKVGITSRQARNILNRNPHGYTKKQLAESEAERAARVQREKEKREERARIAREKHDKRIRDEARAAGYKRGDSDGFNRGCEQQAQLDAKEARETPDKAFAAGEAAGIKKAELAKKKSDGNKQQQLEESLMLADEIARKILAGKDLDAVRKLAKRYGKTRPNFFTAASDPAPPSQPTPEAKVAAVQS